MPQDYYAKTRHAEGQPTWFLFSPENYRALYINHRSILLTLQYHPPERDPRLLKGQYRWEAFRPAGDWSGAFLFAPRDTGQPLREEALNAAYASIAVNRRESVELQSPAALNVIRPDLVYFADDTDHDASIQCFVNGRLHFTHAITGPRGRWTLPPVFSGANHIRITAPDKTQVYLNHVVSKPPARLLRFANRIDGEGLSFDFYKQTAGKENLSLKWFFPSAETGQSVFRVELAPAIDRPLGPYKQLSLLERKFVVTPPEESKKVPVMQSETEFVTTGQTFFYPFGDDLPPGQYRVNIERVSGPDGYLQMYRVLPGRFPERTMKKEPIRP